MLGVSAFSGAIVIVGYQVVTWLKTGAWEPVTLLTWAPELAPHTEWVGLNYVINNALDTSASLLLFLLALLLWSADLKR